MSAKAAAALDQHHLFRRGQIWWIRYVLPTSMGGRRVAVSTKTTDLRFAIEVRERILGPILREDAVAEVGRRLAAAISHADGTASSLADSLGAQHRGPTLRQAAKRFLENRRAMKARSAQTVEDYGRTLVAFEAVVGNPRLGAIESADVRRFRDRLLVVGRFWCRGGKVDLVEVPEDERLSHRTIVKAIKNLSTFLTWGVKEELIARNPAAAVDLPTVTRNRTRPPPPELADALCALPFPPTDTIGRLEWQVLPFVARYTGARVGEYCRLTVDDIRIVDGIRCFAMFTEKTASRGVRTQADVKRLVPIHSKLLPMIDRVLAERRNEPEALLFPNAGNLVVAQGRFMRYGLGWASRYNRKVKGVWAEMKAHAWRAYAITEMARARVPEEVRRRLVGHALVSVHDAYCHVDVARLKEGVETIA